MPGRLHKQIAGDRLHRDRRRGEQKIRQHDHTRSPRNEGRIPTQVGHEHEKGDTGASTENNCRANNVQELNEIVDHVERRSGSPTRPVEP